MTDIEIPKGSTSSKWFSEGYQAALVDISRELGEGGEEAVREWLRNNMRRSLGGGRS